MQVTRRATDDAKDLARRRLLLAGFGEFALQTRIRYQWRSIVLGVFSRRAAPRAKLSVCYGAVLLAPG
ncbi:MAG: hypothetical protein ABW318_16765, partial [Vicinamibacterales bacterium]